MVGSDTMKLTGYPSIDRTHERMNSFFQNHPWIPNMSIVNAISLLSTFYKNSPALNCLDITLTYQELLSTSKVLAAALQELGIRKGDIITISMPNVSQAVALFLAANHIGAVTTFLNPGCSKEEVSFYLNLFASPLFINFDKEFDYNSSIKQNTSVRQIITLTKEDLHAKRFPVVKKTSLGYVDYIAYHDLQFLAEFSKGRLPLIQSGKQDALILFTSGSTGKPKSVVLTNENILASGYYMKNTGNIQTNIGEKCLVCVPFSYPYGFVTSALMSLLCGREAILAPNLSGENISYFLAKNPAYLFGSPALLELICRNVPKQQNLSSIHSFISGGDFLSPEQALAGKKFFEDHHAKVEIYNGSGNAESTGASTIAVGSPVRPETVGKILVGSRVIIVDPDTFIEKKYGEEGMLCIAGKHIFKEYYKEPILTEEAKLIYHGKEYLKTGAIGFLDEQGYFTLTGRASRFYIRADLNKVYCEHVQQFINHIDIVEACAVVPMPDKELLYTSRVYLVIKEGIPENEDTLKYIQAACYGKILNKHTGEEMQLKDFEIPTSFTFVPEIPRTKADKIDYSYLEDCALKEDEQIKEKPMLLYR